MLIEWTATQPTKETDFYPFTSTNGIVRTGTEQIFADRIKIRLRKEVEKLEKNWPDRIAGLLIEKGDGNRPGNRRATNRNVKP